MIDLNINTSTSVRIGLRMDHEQQTPCYSFPLFVPDNNLFSRKIPIIAFWVKELLVEDPSKLQTSGKDLVRSAFETLRCKTARWQQYPAAINQPDYIIAKAEDSGSVAEKILDVDFMEQARLILQCNKLEVSIPHTGVIIACKQTPDEVPLFEQAIKKEMLTPGFSALSDVVFTYTEGQIINVRNRKLMSADQQAETPGPVRGEVLKIIKIPVFTGDFFYKVEVGAADDGSLLDLCEKIVIDLLKKSVQFNSFLGIMEFVINRSTNPYNPTLDAKLTRFWELLRESQEIQDMVKQMKKDIEVSILFGEHLANGEPYRRRYFKVKYLR